MSRLKVYVAGSAVMANVVLLRAYYERPNFYSAAVYISQSTGSLMFLVNLMLIVAASVGYGLQRLFYGPLRAIETEQLYDKAWFAVSETLLAMTIFRDDIGIWFFTMFLCLLAGKVWQWIGEGRVEFLEQQPPANPKLFHTRLISSLLLSVGFDIFMMQYCIDSILSDARPGVMVMFGFEYVLLAIASISTLVRYTLSLVEIYITRRQETAQEEVRRAAREEARQRAVAEGVEVPTEAEDDEDEGDVPGWEEKGRWVFYLDLATDFIKSVVYLGFFMILMTFYGIPIHIMRDLFMTIRSLIKRINDFVQYRNATRDMNTRYPDATAEELERENTCIVCREEMRPWVHHGAEGAPAGRRMDERQRPKKLPCGHILHFGCLRSWLERQQVCPTCRRPVLAQPASQNNQRDNHANQGHQGQQGQGPLQGILRGNPPQGVAGQPGQGQQAFPQGGQPQPPAGNLRVFNFGPFRIALGNLRVPPGQQDNAVVRNAMDQLRQQAVANNAAQIPAQQNHNQAVVQPFAPTLVSNLATGPIPGAIALHPADVQSDILRIQQNIIESLRQLNAQHEQLEVVHRLLGELHRLQQTSGITAATGQELPPIMPLNPPNMDSFVPQAYFARGPVLSQGDTGVPEGLTLPEGWTLRPMAQAPRPGQESSSISPPSQASQAGAEAGPSTSTAANSQSQVDSSLATTTTVGPTAESSPKPVEPSSLESSWSFGNGPERNEAESSTSAVAESSSESQNMNRRTVTVEDVEDNGQ
ncbi:RING finger domain-containing protein [Cucurbitaria berberidis CBS 394.84]|uniref:RING-type E3 ubiquitin transferase n=1 Tax=Cucurbitaria berberidis CBS 394.84 TaxID=1168544 RepID=A0A9P4GED7_9PLEO|nr:RING finger domain-containing protein [Cucurbitaria berberidis CBS 394.84]KAF1843776.1 RING finger domain-containing protein [Cucurbitaria berberidis CBS 394.84]